MGSRTSNRSEITSAAAATLRPAAVCHSVNGDALPLIVTSDLPPARRSTEPELVVVETYFADILDAVLGGHALPASSRHKARA